MGTNPFFSRKALHFEKWWHPKNPRWADRGEGCTALSTKCLVCKGKGYYGLLFSLLEDLVISVKRRLTWFTPAALTCACLPHKRNTTWGQFLSMYLIISSVNCCHPIEEWDAGEFARTVREAFSSRTPCLLQPSRYPCFGALNLSGPKSSASSLYMFWSDGGGGTPGFTEKQRPCAWLTLWYGSLQFYGEKLRV